MAFQKGQNTISVKARKGKQIVEDRISFVYQTEKWGKPAKTVFEKISESGGMATLEVKLLDAKNILCLDAQNWVRFEESGEGALLDNQGTSSGSRLVQLYNGRARISVKLNSGQSVISAKIEGIPASFVTVNKK